MADTDPKNRSQKPTARKMRAVKQAKTQPDLRAVRSGTRAKRPRVGGEAGLIEEIGERVRRDPRRESD